MSKEVNNTSVSPWLMLIMDNIVMCCILSIYILFASLDHYKEDNPKPETSRENSDTTASDHAECLFSKAQCVLVMPCGPLTKPRAAKRCPALPWDGVWEQVAEAEVLGVCLKLKFQVRSSLLHNLCTLKW